MATQKISIDLLTNINQSLKSIRDFQSQANKSFSSIEKSSKKTGNAIKNAFGTALAVGGAVALAKATQAVVGTFKDAVNEAIQLENALLGLNAVAAATGNDVDQISSAAKDLASDGLIPLAQVSASLKNLLATGLSADESVKTFKALRDAAAFNRQGTLDLGQAIEGATQGIKNQNSILIDNAGITKNLSLIYKDYATSIGTTVGKLTDAQKAQAAYLGIQKEAGIFQGNYNLLLNTFSGAVGKVSGNWRFLLADLGEFITKSPIIIDAINSFGEGLADIRLFLKENADGVRVFVRESLQIAVVLGEKSIQAVLGLAKAYFFLKDVTESVFRGIFRFLDKLVLNFEFGFRKIKNLFNLEIAKKLDAQHEEALKVIDQFYDDAAKDDKEGAKKRLKVIEGFGVLVEKISNNISASVAKNPVIVPVTANDKEDKLKSELDAIVKDVENRTGITISLDTASTLKGLREGFEKVQGKLKNFGLDLGQIAGAFAGGAKGAKKLVSSIASAGADALVPGLGQALGPLFDLFSEGPEATRQVLTEFAKALPDVIQGFIEAIPVVIEVLAEQLPTIIERLAEKVPDIITALVRALPKVSIALAKAIAFDVPLALIREAPRIVGSIIKAFIVEFPKAVINGFGKALGEIGNIFKKIFKFDGGGKGKVEKFIGLDFPFIAFAEGGKVPGKALVPGDSFRNDLVPTLLSPGEIVIPRSAVSGGGEGIANFLRGLGVEGFGFGGFIKKAFKKVTSGVKKVVSKVAGTVFGIPGDLIELINSLKNVGFKFDLKDIASALIKNPFKFITNTLKGGLGLFKEPFKKMFKAGFANGGLVPGGFPNDSFPARLSSGEFVVNNDLTPKLSNFLDGRGGGNNEEIKITNALLGQLVNLMSEDKTIETSVQLNQKTFADIILNLNRQNARLA